jgi:hypothetical protein
MDQSQPTGSAFYGISIGSQDKNHRDIVDVYANEAGRYAVYQTPKRVIILYAEDPLVQRAQRQRIAKLAALRSQIDGDLADWRGRAAQYSRLPGAARQFDLRVSAALIEALEGDADTSLSILAQVADDIKREKASRARLSYLLWTFATAAVFIGICLVVYRSLGWMTQFDPKAALALLRATITGALGAFYSIALDVNSRKIRNDQRRLDHITDALVRISIGVLAAFILETFLLTGTVRIGFSNNIQMPSGTGGSAAISLPAWPVDLIAGFLAGFAERLVPNLLATYSIDGQDPDQETSKTGGKPKSSTAGAEARSKASDLSTSASEPDIEALTEEDDVDGCMIGHAEDGPATPDDMLPAASGGVARE